MLNGSGERGHLYLVPIFKGNAFSFCPFSMMLAVVLSHVALIILRYVPSIPGLLRVFNTHESWILSKAVFASIEIIMWVIFFFSSVYVTMTFINLHMLNQTCISGRVVVTRNLSVSSRFLNFFRFSGSHLQSQNFGRSRWIDHLRLGVQDKMDQHGETPCLLKIHN